MGVIVREKIVGSGEFWIFINHKGTRKARKIGSEELAEAAATKIRAQIELGTLELAPAIKKTSCPVPKVVEYTLACIDSRYPKSEYPSTNDRYKTVVNNDVAKGLGNRPVTAVTSKELYDFLNNLRSKGRTGNSIGLTRTVLNLCFSMAEQDKLITTNPLASVLSIQRAPTIQNTGGQGYRLNTFTFEQMAIFESTAMAMSPDMYGPLFMCGFRTGMRLGELLALTWNSIDWQRKVILVNQSYRRGELGYTKTRKSREVDMSDQLITTLSTLLEKQTADAVRIGNQPLGIIFHSRGKFRSQNATRKAFKEVLKRAGLPNKRIHDMRHTFASLLLTKGAPPHYVKDQLGHSKISMTLDIYGQFIPGSNRDLVNRLDNLVPPDNS